MVIIRIGHYPYSMDKEKLGAYLEELKVEIGHLETSDQGAKTRLIKLTGNIEGTLRSSSEASDSNELAENVQSNIEHFEAEHPRITAVLARIVTLLSDMGI